MFNYSELPEKPGCYIFKNKQGRIIYVGKAKSLKKRVASYFTKNDHEPKTQAMVCHINSFDYIVTNNEVEALVLENSLIKKNKPKYNINLKDSKKYAYLKLTSEVFPRIVVAREKGKNTYGPFVSAQERDNILKNMKKTFRLRTCKKMPKRPCLRYHIKLCDAPCNGSINSEEYNQKIKKVTQILKGNVNSVINKLRKEIEMSSKELYFERAIEKRNQLEALQYLKERQNMDRQKKYDEDIINYLTVEGQVFLLLFNVYKGVLNNKQEFVFEHKEDFLREFIVQYYSEEKVPKELIIPENIDPRVKDYLSEKRGNAVKLTLPLKGQKKQLLELARKNVEIDFFGHINKVCELRDKLKLKKNPNIIEVFDISHISGSSTVASMVQFRNGKPNKSNYRRYKIKSVEGVDDFSSIAEVIRRRYKKLLEETKDLPDLIVVDGGKGQLSSAIEKLKELNLKIPAIALAKKDEEIYFPGSKYSLRLDGKDTALKFLQEMRDEAHRFAIKYSRLLHKKSIKK
ncbi:MAG: excinuclease ABC subunit UvrC [Candidatus Nanoarchaeia archaeon]